MGRGGKKKNKQGEKVDLGLGSLSLEAGESSASAQGAPSAAGVSAGGGSVLDGGKKKEGESAQQTEPSTSQASGDTKKDDTKVEKVPPKVESVPEKIEEEESAGLGLGLGGGKKKRPKKKPAAGAATTPAAPTPAALGVTTPAFAPGPTAPAKPPASEAPGPPPGFTSTQPAGWGARGRGAPSLAPPQQAFPTAFPQQPPHQQTFPTAFPQQPPPHQTFPTAFPQQPPHQQTFPTSFPQQPPPQQTFPTAFPQQPPHQQTFPTSFPQQPPPQQTFPTAFPQQPPHQQTFPTAFPQQPPPQPRVQTPAPVFVPPPVSSGRGRGGSPTDTKISVVSSTPPVQPAKQTAVACRFQIPAKVPPSGRAPALKTTVTTNYLEMTIQPIKVNRYDVTITPDRPKKLLPKVFNAAKAKKFPKQFIAFDQRKNCYSLIPLWQGSDERISISVEILDDNDAKMAFEISLKKTGIVDLGTIINHMKNLGSSLNTPMEAIQCVDVILQQGTLESYVKAGRQFFKRPRNPIDLSTGLEMWTGLFQSAIFTSRAFINIDVAHKGFPRQQSLIDALQNDFRLNPRQPLDRQKGVDAFLHFIKGLRVKANIGGAGVKRREFICNGIADPPSRITFQLTDAAGKPVKEITVAKYFETEKKCRLRFPDLNCMWVGPRDRKIYYPMELLEVVYGQALNKQLNERQLSTMVREAATPPSDRLNKIKEVISDMKYSENPCFKHFKMEIDNKFFQVDAKILQAPKIDVGSGRPIEPRRGVWQANRFLRAGALESWGFIVVDAIDANSCNVDNMISMIMRIGSQMGMAVNPPAFTKLNVTQMELRNVLLTAQERKLNFMFIIVSARDKDAYHKVKRKAELEVGILTQCIKEMTASRRMNEQTVRNILLKVNSKLMGVNQGLDGRSLPLCLKNGGVMVVGADVTHPSPDQMAVPSIAAVTASIDPKCFQYNIEMSIQTPKHEIIVDFENMMFDHLKIYRAHNQNALPRKIFVFRDGVSEGQFAQVMNSELVAVQRAYARHDRVNKPEILFLLVQKRHHTRFFMGDKNPQNVEPGTVVDTHIVHPKELDFYLVSHQAIKGTARPTRYHAVCNDGNIPSDEVEQLTFYLCHLYSRCTRSVSYPTPTYYAHLACFRAKSLTFGDRFDNAVLDRQPQRLRVLDKMLQCSRMFFV